MQDSLLSSFWELAGSGGDQLIYVFLISLDI